MNPLTVWLQSFEMTIVEIGTGENNSAETISCFPFEHLTPSEVLEVVRNAG